ncbi:GAG-pre-integrase domain-containing protein [Hirsutella rhossiliensis]|uniref:GAG-pre-integrase domain-containing protein n=1 Tax=Hirsutella rhossiliensis TaxID=111463 RepID=A0A9P8MXL0_9HYPO|nr:GAG-pre-integrase domain-containing protein [Hirsutella rhossiliensis]KAH0964193.1 GAG-pre-integrase domain-containing protein [Hirsutella rhossiliensis]
MLCQQAFNHLITGEDVLRFQGIIIDTGAAKVSTAGYDQCIALQREDPAITLDKTTAGQASIKFGNGEAILSLGIYFNNLTDTIVGRTTLPVIRKWGHPWFLLPKTNEAAIAFLTESEIRTLHRRFGHPAVPRLHNLLRQAGHNDVTIDILENISRFCHHCQMHSQAPRRFKFTLKDDQEFNYEIVADVLYLGTPQRPVLHVDTWEALRALWIDTYLGPPDTIKHDAGTNFASLEFRNEVERYHAPLRPINDTTGPNGIVPTLLVFGAYPRMALDSPLLLRP